MELVLTIVSVIIALIALWQTKKQIELSNKHQLFDRRLEKYLFIKKLFDMYTDTNVFVKDKKALAIGPEMAFTYLTYTTELEECIEAIDKPLNSEKQSNFLKKIEQIKYISEESQMIWEFEEINLISDFLDGYAELLIKLYQQKIYIENVSNNNGNIFDFTNLSEDDLLSNAEKIELFASAERLNILCEEIEKEEVLDKLKKQTQLIKVINK